MNQLHERLGALPYLYTAHSVMNDYQVTIEGPSGRAIITEIAGGEDYAIETMFYGQNVRRHSVQECYGDASPRLAMERLIALTETHLANRGVALPPLVDPRRKVARVCTVVVLSALLLGVLAWGAAKAFAGTGEDIAPRPSSSFTVAPGAPRGN